MKRFIVALFACSLLLGGCKNIATKVKPIEESAQEMVWQDIPLGRIGDDFAVTRAQAAKMMALAFYTKQELENLPVGEVFPDVPENQWYAPYVRGAVEKGFLAGGEMGFQPDAPLTLEQTQYLLERLHPEHKTKINVTEESKNKPVSYSLWIQIFEDALMQRRGEDSLYSYGLEKEKVLLLAKEKNGILGVKGLYHADGLDMTPYYFNEITALCKEGEIVALLEVTNTSPVISNIYYRSGKEAVELETGQGVARIPWADTEEAKNNPLYQLDAEGIGQVQLTQGNVEGITAIPNMGRQVIKKVDTTQMELAGQKTMPWAADAGVYEKTENGLRRRPVTRLICGTDLAEIYGSNGEIHGAVIQELPECNNIRALLSATGQKGYIHPTVSLSSDAGFTLFGQGGQKDYGPGVVMNLLEDTEAMELLQAGRIWAQGKDSGLLQVHSIVRDGKNPQYAGVIEMESAEDGYRLVNELPLEDYLRGVVPGEMPVSFGLEALKVQAVAARSYAYNQYYANRYANQGAHVDDTTLTQVYVGAPGDPLSDQAIAQTAGECLTYDQTVVVANFYSSTCGYSADAGDVWRGDGGKTFPGEGKPYLKSKAQGLQQDFGDVTQEENAAAFLKNQDIVCFDSDSPYVRWQVKIPKENLIPMINQGAKNLWEEKSGVIQIKSKEEWINNIPLPVFTDILDIQVVKRGRGGIAMIVEITGDTGTIRIITENAIRRILKPAKVGDTPDILLTLRDGSERKNMSLLPSGFITFEMNKEEKGNIRELTIYGGGNGHGAGMSQYGARGMASQGYSYQEILEHYFEGGKVSKVIS